MDLALANEGTNRGRPDQDFDRGDEPARNPRNQTLGDDGDERSGELLANLTLLVAGKTVNDAVNGLSGVIGMERGENEMPGLGRGYGRPDRIGVAHLADHRHVHVLAEHGAEGLVEALGVGTDLALVNDRAIRGEKILDGIFDRDDVIGPGAVDVIHHGGERRGLAVSGRPDDEHESLRPLTEGGKDRKKVQFVEVADLGRDVAESRSHVTALKKTFARNRALSLYA